MKATKYLLAVLLIVTAVQTSRSQDDSLRFIDVEGLAEEEITPNLITLTVRLKEYEKDRKLVSLTKIDAGFLQAIQGSGLDEDKVVLAEVSSDAFGNRRKRKAFAAKTYELTFSDTKELLSFTGRLNNIDIDNMYISRLSHTDIEQLRIKVKVRALMLAKVKAKALAEAVGSQLGEVTRIQETDVYQPDVSMLYPDAYYMRQEISMDKKYKASDIGFKKLKLRYEINARFAIE